MRTFCPQPLFFSPLASIKYSKTRQRRANKGVGLQALTSSNCKIIEPITPAQTGGIKAARMKRNFTLLTILLLLLLACKEQTITYNIPDETIVKVLADMHISESASSHLSLVSKDSMSKVYLQQVLTIHQVNPELFNEDYEKLKNDPEKLKTIYSKVIETINTMKIKKDRDRKK